MGTRAVAERLRVHKQAVLRGAGFVAAALALCGALTVGSILREPAREPALSESGDQGDKDQSRVAVRKRAAAPASEAAGEGAAETLAAAAESYGEWREQDFTFVTVVDGRTFTSRGMTLTLAGLELPDADQVCRTLDNRLEPCGARAATQLELLTRSRVLACRFRMTTSSEAVGSCRTGGRDLAERMLRTGHVRAEGARRAVLARAAEPDEAR